MRIGFDFRPATKKNSRRRGIGKYTRQLLYSLLEVNDRHHYVLYTHGDPGVELSGNYEKKALFHLPKPSRLNWVFDLLLLPHYIRRDRIGIFHAMEITSVPVFRGTSPRAKIWVTVHDLIPFIFWEETVRRVPRDYAYALKRSLKRVRAADLILTDSLHSKKDICQRLEIPEGKVQVVYLGCDEKFQPVDQERAKVRIQRAFGISDPFLFYVGGSDHRKNLNRLMGAFSQIRHKGYPGKLVLAGETFLWDIEEVRVLRERIEQLRLESVVLFTGYIPDQDLPNFYAACDLFVFPSLYEGFGLPVLEAMKCGAAVLASRASSIPEVAGEAAVYFNPEEEESMVSSFLELYGNKGKVEKLRQEGFQRAAGFSWRHAAQKIHRLYEMQCRSELTAER